MCGPSQAEILTEFSVIYLIHPPNQIGNSEIRYHFHDLSVERRNREGRAVLTVKSYSYKGNTNPLALRRAGAGSWHVPCLLDWGDRKASWHVCGGTRRGAKEKALPTSVGRAFSLSLIHI